MNLKKIPKWAWVAAGLVAVGVFWYFHNRANALGSAANTTDTASPTDTASLGGTPATTDTGATDSSGGLSATDTGQMLSDYAAEQQTSFDSFLQNLAGLLAAGVAPPPATPTPDVTPAPAPNSNIPPADGSGVGGGAPIPASTPVARTATPAVAASGFSTATVRSGPAAGTVITTAATPAAERAASVPTFLSTHGSDAAQIHFYTYKSQAQKAARPGQSVKFRTGSGYYVA